MLFETVRVKNYRCLRDVELKLGAFTMFVGPNASGKTAIADALTSRVGFSQADCWRQKPENSPVFNDGSGGRGHPGELRGSRTKYTFQPAGLRQGTQANSAWSLDQGGGNLANLFDTLSRSNQERFVSDFSRLVPVYQDIAARAQQGKHHLEFQDRWDDDVWYQPGRVSDGTMLATAFVALGYQRDVPDLAVFEDPDQGLHPYLQRHVVELLRGLSRGEIGPKPIQIVCTTHSKALLDYLQPEEVRFVSRDPDTGETRIQAVPMDNPRWQQLYDRFQGSMGDIWMTGAVGGVPGL